MAAYIDFYIDRGSTFNTTITIDDDITGNVVNISGYSLTSKIRKSYYSVTAEDSFRCSISDAANGVIALSLSSANTANLKPGKYVFDLLTINTSNATTRILEGKVIINPLVSY